MTRSNSDAPPQATEGANGSDHSIRTGQARAGTAPAAGAILGADSAQAGRAPLRALAIDDCSTDRMMLQRLLRKLDEPAIELVSLANPEDALEALRSREFDLLLIDFDLGVCSGIDLLTRAREEGATAPAILLTGRCDAEVAVLAMHAGFADYLSKNAWSSPSLKRSISNVIEKHALECRAEEYFRRLEASNQDLQARTAEISSFYHTLAHELKTPLTATREFLSIVLDGLLGDLNDDQVELLGLAKGSCDQLRRSINDLFDVSRIETGKLQVTRKTGQLNEVVGRALACFEPQGAQGNIKLVQLDGAPLPACQIDEDRILQVLNNLLGNALKFTPPGGSIEVRTWTGEGSKQYVSVRDSGAGITPEDLPSIFERLYQASGHATVKGGMGLGLHLCRELVRLHGGDIGVESELGKGSCFTFWIAPEA